MNPEVSAEHKRERSSTSTSDQHEGGSGEHKRQRKYNKVSFVQLLGPGPPPWRSLAQPLLVLEGEMPGVWVSPAPFIGSSSDIEPRD